jgi:plasmid stabilization system protein ParE
VSRGLHIAPAAARDIVGAYNWYENQQPGLGEQFRTELHVAFALVPQFSEAGPAVHRDLRRLLVRRFPYALYYRLTDTDVVIRACLHLHSDPSRWQRRA